MDTTTYFVVVSLTIWAHFKGINPIHCYCMLILHYQFYFLLQIRCQQTVLTNMLCYISLCTSSMLGMSAIFPRLMYSVFLSVLYPCPINRFGLLAWVHTFHLAIACITLGGSHTSPYSYLAKQIGWGASFSG